MTQKNHCSKLHKKGRKACLDKTNPKNVYDNKSFWKNQQP